MTSNDDSVLPPDDVAFDADDPVAGVVTFFSPDQVEAMGGLPPEGIIGHMEGTGQPAERFQPNPAFARLMHQVIADRGPDDPALREAAEKQGSGWLYIVDQRVFTADPGGRIPPEDIIGAFSVENGQVAPDSYMASDQHLLFSHKGLVQLPDWLHTTLLDELRRRAEASRGTTS